MATQGIDQVGRCSQHCKLVRAGFHVSADRPCQSWSLLDSSERVRLETAARLYFGEKEGWPPNRLEVPCPAPGGQGSLGLGGSDASAGLAALSFSEVLPDGHGSEKVRAVEQGAADAVAAAPHRGEGGRVLP